MKKYFLILSLFASHSFYAQTLYQNEPIARVRIINTVDTLKISFSDEWILASENLIKQFKPEDGEILFTIVNSGIKMTVTDCESFIMNENFILHSSADAGSLKIKNVPVGVGWWWESKEDRIYEGEIYIYINSENNFDVIVHLPLEQYLKGVVPNEIGGTSPIEALKAQTVAARSEAVMALTSKLYGGEHHDLTSGVECQVFGGNGKRTEMSDRAVIETKSLILSENGKPINAYYASNCGGHSELIRNVWFDRPASESYNISHPDWDDSIAVDFGVEENARGWIFSNPPAFCNPEMNNLPEWSRNNFRWKREISTEEIGRMTSKGKDSGNLIDLKILKRGTSGRTYHAKFIYEKDSTEVLGELNIRRMFDPPLRSSCFVIDKVESGLTFYGAGWGHGVGMCQSGAITMANRGYNFEQILKHYYRKADLIKVY
ncbi:MAG: SpoIID/LytB domain-containing protein [Melioribacteraceae bacterium]|nr:SpoIID/LytB domain-containing protein [Melioribacteraceae bacterium]